MTVRRSQPPLVLTPKAAYVPKQGTQLQRIDIADLGQGVGALGDVQVQRTNDRIRVIIQTYRLGVR